MEFQLPAEAGHPAAQDAAQLRSTDGSGATGVTHERDGYLTP